MGDKAAEAKRTLTGKVALVTGGARGVGLEICRQLAVLGAKVIVAARDETKAEAAANELRRQGHQAMGLRLDVTLERDREAAYAYLSGRHGVLDILINNAGV